MWVWSQMSRLSRKLQKLGFKREFVEAGDRDFGADIYRRLPATKRKKEK